MEGLEFLSYVMLMFSMIFSFRKILILINQKYISGYLFLLPVLFLFYVFPLLTDFITDIKFDKYFFINEAMEDKLTTVIYNIYMSLVIIFFTIQASRYGGKNNKDFNFKVLDKLVVGNLLKVYTKYKFIIWFLFLLPIFAVLLFGNYNYYSLYLTRDLLYVDKIPESHQFLSKLFELSSLIGAFIIGAILAENKIHNRNKKYLFIIIAIILISVFWLHGKRSIIASFGLTVLMLLFITKLFSTRKLLLITAAIVSLFIGFISMYGKNIKNDPKETYEALRTDFSRDYGVRFVIYNDLILERHILPDMLQSFIFNVTFFVPRDYWPNKPQPYAVYFTNSAFGEFGNDKSYGWGLTTSIFSECISNIGFFGFLLAPYGLNFILKTGARSDNVFFKIFSIIIAILFLVLHPMAFMSLILLYLVFLYKQKNRSYIKYAK